MPNSPEPNTQSQFQATDKERFDLCISMLQKYYDALEGRLMASIASFIVVIGWIITSKDARESIRDHCSFFIAALAALLLVIILYAWNVSHWINRWREIRRYVDSLHYVEAKYYARYELPGWTFTAYFFPVALLDVLAIAILILIRTNFSFAIPWCR